MRGSAYADILTGSDSSVLEGGAGSDQLIGNVIGNDASIVASYQHATAGVTVSLLNPGSNTGKPRAIPLFLFPVYKASISIC